jgi:hypothetical protein
VDEQETLDPAVDEIADFIGPDEIEISVDTILQDKERDEFIEALYLGRKSTTVDVLGHNVSIRTLTVDEELQIALVIKRWEGTQGYTRAYKSAVVAASVSDIDNTPLYVPLSQGEQDNLLKYTFDKIIHYYPIFVDSIYEEVVKLEQTLQPLLEKLGKSSS